MQQKAQSVVEEILPFSNISWINAKHTLYAQYLAQIIGCSQWLYGASDDIGARLASEIATMTHEQVHLYLHRQSASLMKMVPLIDGRRGFVVQWGEVVYGSLQVMLVDESRDKLVFPISLSERLARDCGWCLYVLEKEALLQRQGQQRVEEAMQKVSSLSFSEHKVFELMVKGFSTRAIADTLQVSKRTVETHQRNIYQLLNVHSQREAVLIGLAAGLFAF